MKEHFSPPWLACSMHHCVRLIKRRNPVYELKTWWSPDERGSWVFTISILLFTSGPKPRPRDDCVCFVLNRKDKDKHFVHSPLTQTEQCRIEQRYYHAVTSITSRYVDVNCLKISPAGFRQRQNIVCWQPKVKGWTRDYINHGLQKLV